MKSVIFAKILNTVSKVTELEPEKILSMTKTDDLVAARSLFVHFCVARGIPSVSIASFLGRGRRNCVNRYLANYQSFYKSSGYFRDMQQEVNNLLSSDE